MLKSGLGLPNNIVLETSLLLILPFCGNECLEWFMNLKKRYFHELCVSLVGHIVCGAARSLLDGLYGPLDDVNVLSFWTDV